MASLEKGNLNKGDKKAERNKTTTAKYERAAASGNKRFYAELRLMQKAANQRMVRLEHAGIKSPAYLAVQAKLEVLGKRTKGDHGRRFSETGKATYNEMEIQKKILEQFLYGDVTSTVKGAKQYEKDVWETANKNQKLSEAGISKDDWLNFWASMPDRKDRLYGSEQIVAIVRSFTIKRSELMKLSDEERQKMIKAGEISKEALDNLIDEDAFSVEEIADEIQASKNLKDAYKKLGLSSTEVRKAKIKKKAKI